MPGVHTPVHAPPTHAWLVHEPALCHVPDPPHVWGCWPAHCTCPGAHTPWHDPETHVWFEHAAPVLFQVPVESHVCGCCGWLGLHSVLVGEHDPLQAPLMQAWLVQATGAPHVPVLLQSWVA